MYPDIPLEYVDSIVSAELPLEQDDSQLRALILKFNMHPLNHLDNPNSRCNRGGRCVWNFPLPLNQSTSLNQHGRLEYRRRKEEDRWVVSYMPCLTRLLECHVNVDICFTVNVFMYLYKYLFKGPDRAMFNVNSVDEAQINEIDDYINGRYLSSSEAAWRILQFNVTQKSPSVTTLSVHLPNQNLRQMYRKNGTESEGSTLARYFARPVLPQFASLLYTDYYQQYRFLPYVAGSQPQQGHFLEVLSSFPQRLVVKRTTKDTVARIVTVPPRFGELFYLRALLLRIPGKDFTDIRTVNGIIHSTFQQAAIALGLFQNGEEAENVLQEAVESYTTPSQLRFLFAHILLNTPCPAINLFEKYQENLSADYLDKYDSPAESLQHTLLDLSRHLVLNGGQLKDFGLPEPEERMNELYLEDNAFSHRRDELVELSIAMQLHLLPAQLYVFQTILQAIQKNNQPTNQCFFLDGKAGRGKTYTVNAIVNYIRGQGNIVVIAGSTALSVTLYERGKTAHSTFGIPVVEVNYPVAYLKFYVDWI